MNTDFLRPINIFPRYIFLIPPFYLKKKKKKKQDMFTTKLQSLSSPIPLLPFQS